MENELDSIRDDLTKIISRIGTAEKNFTPPVVQELVIARRAAEDCRMRLGVGVAYNKGFDPWTNKVESK